jgi:hypothetical protein
VLTRRPVSVGFVVDRVALGQVFPLSIIPPMSHAHSVAYHRRFVTSGIDSVVKQHRHIHRSALSVRYSHDCSTALTLRLLPSSLQQFSYFLILFSGSLFLILFSHFHLILNTDFPIIFISITF